MITQPTDVPSGSNTKVSGSTIKPLVPDVTQSHITNEPFISSHHFPQDRWSKDQHIELVNIIGDPGEGMLTRSMAAKLTTTSANECLFADFLFEIKPKRNKKDEHGTTTKNKARLVAQGYSQEEGIDYDETFAPVVRMEDIGIFLSFATYMNFIVFQMDVKSVFLNEKLKEEVYVKQPLGFESSEFPNYVLYVDDIIFGSTSYKLCKQFEKLMTKKFEMSMMGELTYFLGLQIKKDDKIPMVPPNNLGPDLASKPVNETLYRGMIRGGGFDPLPSLWKFTCYDRFLALGWHLEEIHVTWAHLEKKRTR
ncbi:retrovirus-related pol polyprotein from transposon TNT 1-94 [Tanacetum coccineum]